MASQKSRRRFLQGIAALSALSIFPIQVFARMTGAFKANNVDSVMSELFGNTPIVKSSDIIFEIPEIAANGAVVPVSVRTDIKGVQAIYIIIDKNPNPLSSIFELNKGSVADISTRVKMGTTSMTRALVKTPNKVYMASKEVKVTIGGCGG